MSTLINLLFLLISLVLMAIGLIAMAHVFVQDYIERHEREHHRRCGSDRTQTTVAGE